MSTEIQRKASDYHLLRRLWHFLGVMAMVGLYLFLEKDEALWVACGVTLVLGGMDLLRLFIPPLNRVLTRVFKPFLREKEAHGLTAASSMLIGVTFAIALFPKDILLLTLGMLAVADPMAALVGIRFGKERLIGNKSLAGTTAAFLVCSVLALSYFTYFQLFQDRLLLVTVLVGLIGALSELVPIFNLDDNLTFPILSSSLTYGLFYIFGAI
ncbi:hypothetical protein GW916_06100 [bacterium]|nr:hypothetical protein [bacterium]